MIALKYGHFAHYATSDDRGLPILVGILTVSAPGRTGRFCLKRAIS